MPDDAPTPGERPAAPSPADPVDLVAACARLTETWSPRVVAALNDYRFKVARLDGPFVEHAHADTDEAFLVLEGRLTLELPDRAVTLGPGELFVVPRGVPHRPVATGPCHVLLVEPAGLVNTGDATDVPSAPVDRWLDEPADGA